MTKRLLRFSFSQWVITQRCRYKGDLTLYAVFTMISCELKFRKTPKTLLCQDVPVSHQFGALKSHSKQTVVMTFISFKTQKLELQNIVVKLPKNRAATGPPSLAQSPVDK